MLPLHGAQLFFAEAGDGPNVAVLLHGGPGASHDYLRPQLDALAEPGAWRLFYYDQRGSGRSPLDPGTPPGTVADHLADLDAVRMHLGLQQLVLIGYSWGGLLALLYALAHPERVAKLVLISPAPAASSERAEMGARLALAQRRPSVDALRATLDTHDRRARFALAVAGYFVDPRRALELTPFLVKKSAEDAVWKSLGDYDLRPLLSSLSIPALVVHGTEDVVPIETARATARVLGAAMLELPDCSHVPYIEANQPLIAAVKAFLG